MTSRSIRALVLAVGALVLTACPNGAGETELQARDLDVYGTIVAELVDRAELPAPTDTEPTPVAFIESFAPEGIALEVQVEIVARFEGEVDIRFIDERQEAIDDATTELQVRDDGILIGLGPIPIDGPIEVRGELYRTADDVVAYRFRFVEQADRWQLVGQPEPVDPEGLVDGS